MRRSLKFLHELGTVGLMGAAAAQLVIARFAEGMPARDYAVARHAIEDVSGWILVPSALICLLSGLAVMVAHPPFLKRGWALAKLAMTILVLQCTLVAVDGPAQSAATIADQLAAGDWRRYEELGRVLRHERGGTWMLLVLSTINIALAVWRPRFFKTTRATPDADDGADGEADADLDSDAAADAGGDPEAALDVAGDAEADRDVEGDSEGAPDAEGDGEADRDVEGDSEGAPDAEGDGEADRDSERGSDGGAEPREAQ